MRLSGPPQRSCAPLSSSSANAESEPAKSTPLATNCSRPPPEPTGSYDTVASGLLDWSPAIQDCMAASCALEPAPAMLPDAELLSPDAAPPPPLLLSLASPHPAATNASDAAMASTSSSRLIVIEPIVSLVVAAARLAATGTHPVTEPWPSCENAVKAQAGTGSRTRSAYG